MTAQLVIVITGVVALLLLQFGRGAWHRTGSFVGLLGQPFWLWETFHADQRGMFVLSGLYTCIYLGGVYAAARHHRSTTPLPLNVNPDPTGPRPSILDWYPPRPLSAAFHLEITVIELGKKYRDTITGLEGIVLVRCEYLHGVERVELQPVVDKDGKLPTALWIESSRLEPIAEAA